MRVITSINVKGPFFTKDVAATLEQNVETMMAAVAREGEQDVAVQLAAGEGGRAAMSHGLGRLSANIHGRVRGSVPWRRWAAISLYEPSHSADEAVALFAAMAGRHQAGASRGTTPGVESATHAFSRTASRLRRSKAAQVAELTKGLE